MFSLTTVFPYSWDTWPWFTCCNEVIYLQTYLTVGTPGLDLPCDSCQSSSCSSPDHNHVHFICIKQDTECKSAQQSLEILPKILGLLEIECSFETANKHYFDHSTTDHHKPAEFPLLSHQSEPRDCWDCGTEITVQWKKIKTIPLDMKNGRTNLFVSSGLGKNHNCPTHQRCRGQQVSDTASSCQKLLIQ